MINNRKYKSHEIILMGFFVGFSLEVFAPDFNFFKSIIQVLKYMIMYILN